MIQEATLPQSQQIQQQQQQQQHQQHQHRQPPKRKRIKSSQSSNDDANTSGSQCYMGVASGWQNVEQNVRELAPSSQSSSTAAAASAPASTTTATSSACFDGGSRFSNGFQISNDIVSSTAHHPSMDNMDNNGMNDIDEDISTLQPRNRPGLITTTVTPTINPAIIDDDNDGDIFDSAMMPSYHPIGLPPLSYQQSIIMNQMDMVANASSVDVVNNFGINHRLNHNNNSNNNNHNNHDHNQHHICPHQQQPLIPPTITTDTLATTGSTVSITNVSATPSSSSSSTSTSLDNLSQSLTVDNHSLQNHHHHHQNSFHQNHQHPSMRQLPPQQQQFYSNAHNGVGGGGTLVSNGSEASSTSVSNIEKLCFGCRQTLSTSPIIATVSGYHNWHIHCLCCSECGQSLSQSRSCYGRNGRIYCKDDYIKSIKCCKCNRSISSTDWVRRAGTLVYHLACFACDICQRQLSTGEKFTIENLSNNNTIGYQHHSTNNRPNCKNDVRHSMIPNANSAPSTGLANSNQNNYHHHHHHHGHKNNSAYNSDGNYRLVCKLHFGIKDEDVPESTVVPQSGSRALDLDQVPSIENGRLANETHGHRIHPDDSLMIETGGSVDGNSGPEGNPFSTNPSNNNVPGVTTIDQSAVANQNSNLSNCGRNSSLSNSTTGTSTVQSATTPPSTTNSSCGGGGSSGVGAGSGVGIGGNSKTKRVRTTFTEEQLSILQANFQIDSNPDGQDLERIAALTGLSKRVTQVWFQNSRARQKKFMSKSSTSSSATHHHHHHHHHHQPQSQQQRHQLMDDGSHSQAPISLLINGQQPPLTRGTNSGCGVALWSPGTTTSNSSSSSNGIGGSSGNNGMQDNQPTPSESIMLLDSHTNPHHPHHQHHRHHQMVVKNMSWNNPGSSSSSTMASMNETSKLNSTNETSELPSMTSNGNSSNNDGSIVGSI